MRPIEREAGGIPESEFRGRHEAVFDNLPASYYNVA